MAFDISQLQVQLLRTKLQNKDQPLYQLLNQMLQGLADLSRTIAIIADSGGNTPSTIQQIYQPLIFNQDNNSDPLIIPGPIGPTGPIGPIGPTIFPESSNELNIIQLPTIPNSTVKTITTTGTINDLDFNGAVLLRMNNASDATITGLKAGINGQLLVIASIGAGNVFFANQDSGSAAENQLINGITSINTPLAAGKGNAIYQYDAITARWRLIVHNQGAWITPTYSAGNFAGRGSMTWTVAAGDIETLAYLINAVTGTTLINIAINTSSVGGTLNNWLQIQMPFTAATTGQNLFRALDNGVDVNVFASMVGTESLIKILKRDFSNWSASTDNTYVFGPLQVAIQ